MRAFSVSLAALVFGSLLTHGAWPASERSSESAVTGAKVGWHISARIAMPNPSLRPFRVAAGAGFVWVLTRAAASADCARQCYVVRIDPKSNEVVGEPTSLPADPWDLTLGAGSVWVTQDDGSVIRINARTGRVTARIQAHPIYFGSAIAFGHGFVWTGNDDERYKQGSTVSKISPATNRVVGKPVVLRSPQSIAFGHGAVWVADHAGWLVKIDPTTRGVVARKRLDFGAHGLVVTDRAVYVADAHGGRMLEADPRTARIRRIVNLSVSPIYPKIGGGSIWSSSAAIWSGPPTPSDDRVVRIDPRTLSIVQTFHAGGNVPTVGFGFGSAWAPLPGTHEVVRIAHEQSG